MRTVALLMLFVFCAGFGFGATPASAETRSLKLYFLHTGERETITFKRNGKYVQSGLKKINRFLRDWRRNEPTKMDPRLLDLVWEVYQETGSKNAIHVISAYRSPATNSLLRKRGRGVARKSQHTMGKALDFFIPGVPLRKLRNIALKKGLGGVGYYPKSGSPFVHMDTGRVRHWPRMSRKELARVFPRGKTLHVPTDGKPLARYNQAKAEYERKISGRDRIVVARAEEIEKKPGLFARSLGRDDEDEGATGIVSAPRPVAVQRQPAPTPPQPTPAATSNGLAGTPTLPATPSSPGLAAPVPAEGLAPAPIAQTPQTVLAALPPSALPVPSAAPRTPILTGENPQATDTDTLPLGEETLTLALAVPTPANRQPIAATQIEDQLASAEPNALAPTTATANAPRAVLSPSEIADLRQQVYAALKAEHENKPTSVEPAEQQPTVVASLEPQISPPSAEAGSSNTIIPEPNPRNDVAVAQAANEPLEPGTQTTGTVAVPGLSPVQRPTPEDEIETEPVEGTLVASAPIPSPAIRPTLTSTQAARPVVRVATAQNEDEAGSRLTLEQFQSANLDQRLIGKWALASNASIKDIADIRPPAYGRNVIRELPQSVLSSGFSQSNITEITQGFSGSSLEFLDFRRFQ